MPESGKIHKLFKNKILSESDAVRHDQPEQHVDQNPRKRDADHRYQHGEDANPVRGPAEVFRNAAAHTRDPAVSGASEGFVIGSHERFPFVRRGPAPEGACRTVTTEVACAGSE
jgi:hypothetical protein